MTAAIVPFAIAGIYALIIAALAAHDRYLRHHPDIESIDQWAAERDALRPDKEQQ